MVLSIPKLVGKGVHTFTKGISLNVNVMVWLGFELAYDNLAC